MQHGFCWQNEKNRVGIEESYVAMETTAKGAGNRAIERCTVCKDGQIFLFGSVGFLMRAFKSEIFKCTV